MNLNEKDSDRYQELLGKSINLIHEENYSEARDILEKLDQNDFAPAAFYLGCVYEYDEGASPITDYEKAFEYYSKARETTAVHEADIAIARMFYSGRVGKIDFKTAFNIYSDLISQGYHAEGLIDLKLGLMYLSGQGVDKSRALALNHFKQGVSFGHVPCMTMLAHVYYLKKKYFKLLFWKTKSILSGIHLGIFDTYSARMRTD